MRRSLSNVLVTFPDVFRILGLIILWIFFFSWLGLVLWFNATPSVSFNSPQQALSTVQMMFTTVIPPINSKLLVLSLNIPKKVNYPDVLIPYYQLSWYYSLYPYFFFIGSIFLHALLFAVTFRKYREAFNEERQEVIEMRNSSLSKAFLFLDSKRKGFIGFLTVSLLLKELRSYSKIHAVKKKRFFLFFDLLSGNKSRVYFNDFLRFHQLMELKFFSTDEPKLHKRFPKFFYSKFGAWIVDFFRSNKFK